MRLETAALQRRAVLSAALSLSLMPLTPKLPANAISATTMTGKTKPDLGIFLLDAPKAAGKSINADVVLSGGVVATPAFDSPWPLAEGGYYDVEAANREGDTAFLQVVRLGRGESLDKLDKNWYGEKLFSVDGRYGTYGAPIDVKVKPAGDTPNVFAVSFSTLSPGGTDNPRKGLVRAIQAPGSSDVLLLMCSSSATRWKKEGADEVSRQVLSSFRVASTRTTELKPEPQVDYRYGKSSGPANMSSRNDGF